MCKLQKNEPMNTSTEYEIFAQTVYRELSAVDGIKTTSLKHNIQIAGKSGCEHQIDVYWEYELCGVLHKVAIECKNHSRAVEIGKVRDFLGVLFDLEDVAGIMAAKKGYQKGAKKYADFYGINLIELRAPDNSDGLIGEVEILIDMAIKRRLFLVDAEWAEENHFNLESHKNFTARLMNDNAWLESDYIPLETIPNSNIVDKDRVPISTFDELENKLPPEGSVPEYIFRFEDAYVNTKEGRVKIREVKYVFKKEKHITIMELEAKDFVKAILKDALSGEIKMLGKYGNKQ